MRNWEFYLASANKRSRIEAPGALRAHSRLIRRLSRRPAVPRPRLPLRPLAVSPGPAWRGRVPEQSRTPSRLPPARVLSAAYRRIAGRRSSNIARRDGLQRAAYCKGRRTGNGPSRYGSGAASVTPVKATGEAAFGLSRPERAMGLPDLGKTGAGKSLRKT
jgi:hypothetical protein